MNTDNIKPRANDPIFVGTTFVVQENVCAETVDEMYAHKSLLQTSQHLSDENILYSQMLSKKVKWKRKKLSQWLCY